MQKKINLVQQKHPKQLFYLSIIEMWERFAYHGTRGMLAVFMVTTLNLSDKLSSITYGAILAFVYAFTFLGGIVADKIFRIKKSMFLGASLVILGSGIIALSPEKLFFWGISFFIIGTGLFKPNISAMVGCLYEKNDPRQDSAYTFFYLGINIGALLGGMICIYIGKYHSWSWAFAIVALVMTIGLITLYATKSHFTKIEQSHSDGFVHNYRHELLTYLGIILLIPCLHFMIKNPKYVNYLMYVLGPIALIYFFIEFAKLKDKEQRKKLLTALVLCSFSVLFFALFGQSGNSLSLYAKHNLDNQLLFITVDPNVVNNSANAFFGIMLSPILALFWFSLARKQSEPSTIAKFGLGFLAVSAAFYMFYSTRFFANDEGITSLNLFALAYLMLTIGELCIAPIGLSMITRLSPKHLTGMMMGFWFLACSYGQYIGGLLGSRISTISDNLIEKMNAYTQGYHELFIVAFVAGIVLVVLTPLIRRSLSSSNNNGKTATSQK